MTQQFTAQTPDADKNFHSYIIFAGKHVYQITAQSFDEAQAVGYNKAQQDKGRRTISNESLTKIHLTANGNTL